MENQNQELNRSPEQTAVADLTTFVENAFSAQATTQLTPGHPFAGSIPEGFSGTADMLESSNGPWDRVVRLQPGSGEPATFVRTEANQPDEWSTTTWQAGDSTLRITSFREGADRQDRELTDVRMITREKDSIVKAFAAPESTAKPEATQRGRLWKILGRVALRRG
jgi:hypothetical protein